MRAFRHLDVLGDLLVDVGGVGSTVHVDQLDVERDGIRAGPSQSVILRWLNWMRQSVLHVSPLDLIGLAQVHLVVLIRRRDGESWIGRTCQQLNRPSNTNSNA